MTLYSAHLLDLKTRKESQESEIFIETYGFKFPAERRECVGFNEALSVSTSRWSSDGKVVAVSRARPLGPRSVPRSNRLT